MQEGSTAVVHFDRRVAERAEVDLEAKGLFRGAECAVDCQILDASDTGAKLQMEGVDLVPHRFKLFVPETGILYECQKIWQRKNELGVAFRNQTGL